MDNDTELESKRIVNFIMINRPAVDLYLAIQDKEVRSEVAANLLDDIKILKMTENSSVHWEEINDPEVFLVIDKSYTEVHGGWFLVS